MDVICFSLTIVIDILQLFKNNFMIKFIFSFLLFPLYFILFFLKTLSFIFK